MDSTVQKTDEVSFTDSNIEHLKLKYSQEMKNDPNNPLKVCMKLIFNSASEKDHDKRLSLSVELSEFLTKPDGVINLFLALIDFDSTSQKTTTLNQRFIAISNILTQLPKLCMSYDSYCANISKQLKPLVTNEDHRYSQLACIIFKSMLESPHAKGYDVAKVIIDPILEGIEVTDGSYSAEESILAINNLVSNHLPITIFERVFPNLFYSSVCLSSTPSRLKIPLKSSLIKILDDLDPGVASCLLEKTLFFDDAVRRKIAMKVKDEEIAVEVIDSTSNTEIILDHKCSRDVVISILESSTKDLLVLEFFFHFKDVICDTSRDDASKQLCAELVEHLLEHSVEEKATKLDLLTIIGNNSYRSIELIARTLLNYLKVLETDASDKSDVDTANQSMSSCFSILEVLTSISSSEKEHSLIRTKCLPVLKQLLSLLSRDSKKSLQKDIINNLNSLICKIDVNCDEADQSAEATKETEEFNILLKDLNDKLVPVRVHSLVRFKQLIMANNTYAISHISQLYTLVEPLIDDSEPYVFLASINLIAEMAIRKTSDILPSLIQLYTRKDLGLQHRVNIGEALVRLTKQLNATTPHYAQQVINALFIGCEDEDELVRASNLVNIGEICRSLGDSLGIYMIEVLNRVELALQSDTVQVKRAAVDLLRTLLSGLDRLRVESIQRDLKRVYGLLKQLRFNSLDHKLCVQVDLALDEVNRIAREMLNLDIEKKPNLVKNIQVLSLLDR